ncbi:MAG: DUF1559 domain-containing protein [Planctomycetaceae bacterium]|nr:DUF1559 domain-containing protein [Planctomycetaceae bacterium]
MPNILRSSSYASWSLSSIPRLRRVHVASSMARLGVFLGLLTLVWAGGCSPDSDVAVDAGKSSLFSDFDRETWIVSVQQAGTRDLSGSAYDLSLLTQRHFTALVLDGQKLREYFVKRGLDLDEKLLGSAATSVSLKQLKSVIVAFDEQLANSMMGGEPPKQGWFVQVDFNEQTDSSAWNRWLLGPTAAAGTKTDTGALLAPDKSFAIQWRSETQFVMATEEELKRIASGSSTESSELASDIVRNQNQSLLYFTLRAQPLQQLVNQFSQMTAAFGGANAEVEAMFDAVRSLDKVQLRADLQDEQMLQLELGFFDVAAAESVQSMINEGIDRFISSGGGGAAVPLPTPGNANAGLSQDLQKLIAEIQTELTQGGLQAAVNEQSVSVTATRPKRLDEVIDQGLVGIAATQKELAKREKLRMLATALQKFYAANGRYPAESASPMAYRRFDSEASGNSEPVASDSPEAKSDEGPAFSWRVALLPYLGYHELYASFDFTQPWDSEANKKAAAAMPVVFEYHNLPLAGPEAIVQSPEAAPMKSNLNFLTGSLGAMGSAAVTQLEQIADGADRTILLAVTPELEQVWTAPGGWEVNSQSDLARWLQSEPQPLPALFFSGRGIMLSRDTNLEVVQGWVTPAGKESNNRNALNSVTILPAIDP